MPLYEYKCDSCGDVFEVIQKFSDEPLTVHEGCGGAVHRLLTAPAFQFKGTGWYVTDYARGNGSSNGGKKESSNGDTKAAAKSETGKTESKKTEAAAKSDR
jgi:putative FmdB family regulatory protein